MKQTILLVILSLGCGVSMGEMTKKQIKSFKKLVKIDGSNYSFEERRDEKHCILTIEFSAEEYGLEKVIVRCAVELTDKKTKQTYLVTKKRVHGSLDRGNYNQYIGEGYWTVLMPFGEFKRLKVTGYAFEYGIMDGGKFVPFEAEYDDVDTYEELVNRTPTAYPNKCSLNRVRRVYSY